MRAPKTGAVSPVVTGPSKERFKGVNDLIFAANGDLYFTDQGQTGLHDPTGRVFRYSASGQLQCLQFRNGCLGGSYRRSIGCKIPVNLLVYGDQRLPEQLVIAGDEGQPG